MIKKELGSKDRAENKRLILEASSVVNSLRQEGKLKKITGERVE